MGLLNFKKTGRPENVDPNFLYPDTSHINSALNKAISFQRIKPDSAFLLAYRSLKLSKKTNYKEGIAFANYALGIIHLVNFSPMDSTNFYLDNALKLYAQLNNDEGIGKTYYGFAYMYSFQGNLSESEIQLKYALEYFKKCNHKAGLYNTYNSLAYLSKQHKNYQQAYDYQLKCLALAEDLKDTSLLADAQNNLGNLFKDQGMFKHAIDAYFKSLHLSESPKDSNGLAIAYGSIGNMYYYQNDYNDALKFMKIKLMLSLKSNSYWEISKTYNSIALVYEALNKPDTAIVYLHLSLSLNIKMNYPTGIAEAYAKLAQAHLIKHNLDSAQYFIDRAVQLGEKSNTKENIAGYYILSGKIALLAGKTSIADKEIYKGYSIAKESDIPMTTRDASLLLSEIYYRKKNYAKAFQFLNEHIAIKDSLSNAEHLKNITRLELEYDFDKKEQQLMAEKEQEKFMLQSKMDRHKIYFMGISGLIVFTALLVIFYYRHKNVNMKFKTINLEQRLLRTQMNPHFIFNSLCCIQDYILQKNTVEANKFLNRFAVLMRSILENSRKDYIPLEQEINTVKNYLEIQKLRFSKDFDYKINLDNNIDPAIYAVPPMLSQPFIENSIEHGILPKNEKGNIDISYTLQNGAIHYEITDNGVGRKAAGQNENIKKKFEKSSLATILTLERLKALKVMNSNKVNFEIVDLQENGVPIGTRIKFNVPYRITLD